MFAIGVFAGLAVAYAVPLPIARYDFLLLWCLALTFGFWAVGLETWREVLVIFAFHALGLALEIFKVQQGSWLYPGDAVTKVAGVPLFSGFMYAAVGSYICQAWRRFDLRVSHYPAAADHRGGGRHLRQLLHPPLHRRPAPAAGRSWDSGVLRRCQVHFTVGDARYRMPLALSFLLIGFFLWLAENARHVPRRVELPRPGRRLGGGARLEARRLGAAGLDELRAGRHREGPGGPALPRAQRAGRDLRRAAGQS